MKILQQPVKAKKGERIVVSFSQPAVVLLMTDRFFKRYKDGASHRRMGGHYEKSPVEFTTPYDGVWHAVIEKGSHFHPKPITGSVEVLPKLRKDIPYLDEEDDFSPPEDPVAEIDESPAEADESPNEEED